MHPQRPSTPHAADRYLKISHIPFCLAGQCVKARHKTHPVGPRPKTSPRPGPGAAGGLTFESLKLYFRKVYLIWEAVMGYLRSGLLAFMLLLGLGLIAAQVGASGAAAASRALGCGASCCGRSCGEATCSGPGSEIGRTACRCQTEESRALGPPWAATNRTPGSAVFGPPTAPSFMETTVIRFSSGREPLLLGVHGPPLFLKKSSWLV